ncbi:MAG: M48 family metalloprotease [Candidatus Binatia bacterium]
MRRVLLSASILVFLALFLSACAPELFESTTLAQFLANEEREHSKRLLRVSAAVKMNGVELCADRIKPLLGILFTDHKRFPKDQRVAAEDTLPVRENLTVAYVVPGLPAAIGGLRPRDEIIKIAGTPIMSSTNGFRKTERIQQATEIFRRSGQGPINLQILRSGEHLILTLNPILACDYPVNLVNDYSVNGFADGDEIGITTGMLRFVNNDSELALVIGHEMAHIVLGHTGYGSRQNGHSILHGMMAGVLLNATFPTPQRNRGRAFTGMAGNTDRFTSSRDFSGRLASFQDLEREANNLGLYFAQGAGYDVSQAVNLWRRLSTKFLCQVPGSQYGGNYPPPRRIPSDADFY